jgi:hypothetical protein
MTRAEALADINAAASSPEVLGSSVVIDSVNYQAVKKGLTREEAQSFSAAGLMVEGIRISIDLTALGWQPSVGSWLNVDGKDYEVIRSQLSGSLLKMTLTRNVG